MAEDEKPLNPLEREENTGIADGSGPPGGPRDAAVPPQADDRTPDRGTPSPRG